MSQTTKAATPSSTVKKYKLVLLGESGVGKSSVAQRLIKNEWNSNLSSTVGASFYPYTPNLSNPHSPNNNNNNNNNNISFDIWDTAGQERYKSLASMYYRGAAAALIVYDITSHETFLKAEYWIKELQLNSPQTLIMLCGNKADLVPANTNTNPEEKEEEKTDDNNDNNVGVTTAEAKQYCEAHQLLFTEVSAKSGLGVKEAFDTIALKLIELNSANSVRPGGVIGVSGGNGGMAGNNNNNSNSNNSGCCN